MHRFVCLAALLWLPAAQAAVSGTLEPQTIVVTGYAEAHAKPDHATVNIGVDTQDRVTTAALDANTVLMRRVVDAIRALGVPDAAMQTEHFSISAVHPQVKQGYGPDYSITTGYAVSNTLVIKIDDVTKVGAIIDAAVRAGANSSNSVTFEAKDQKSLEDKVLADAVRNARHNAEIMAAAEGAKVGKVSSLANTTEYGQRYPNANFVTGGRLAQEVVVMPGEVPISAQVIAAFSLE